MQFLLNKLKKITCLIAQKIIDFEIIKFNAAISRYCRQHSKSASNVVPI